MNTDNNRRYQQTEKIIADAYVRLIKNTVPGKVTVSDICREAGIHRTTFYGHFQDAAELAAYMEQMSVNGFISSYFKEGGTWNIRTGLQNQLEFYRKNRAVICKHMESGNQSKLFQFYNPLSVPEYREAYIKRFHCKTETEFEYHQAYFNAGIAAIIKKWMLSGCQEPPEDIAEYMIKFLNIEDER